MSYDDRNRRLCIDPRFTLFHNTLHYGWTLCIYMSEHLNFFYSVFIYWLVAEVVAFFVCWAPFHAQRLWTIYMKREHWTLELLDLQNHVFFLSLSLSLCSLCLSVSLCLSLSLYPKLIWDEMKKNQLKDIKNPEKQIKFKIHITLYLVSVLFFISDTLHITVFSWHSLLQVFCISLVPPLTLCCTTSCPGSSAKPSGRPCVGGYLSPTPGAPTSPPTAPPVRGTWATAKCPSVAWLEGSPWRKRNRRLPRAQLRTVENTFIFWNSNFAVLLYEKLLSLLFSILYRMFSDSLVKISFLIVKAHICVFTDMCVFRSLAERAELMWLRTYMYHNHKNFKIKYLLCVNLHVPLCARLRYLYEWNAMRFSFKGQFF